MMHEETRTLELPAAGETRLFRVSKLDAFSGVRVLKLLARGEAETVQELLFSLPDAELKSLMETCLCHAEVSLPAGFIRVWDRGCWGLPEMETETLACFRLTQEVLAWTLSGFFPEGGPAS